MDNGVDQSAPPALDGDPQTRQQWLRAQRDSFPDGRHRRRGTLTTSHGGNWDDRHWSSRLLHWIGDATAKPATGVAVAFLLVGWGLLGVEEGFPTWWQTTLYSVAGSVTLMMAFVIQHTQERQTSATQRKLDELIRATAGADDNLIAVEEADDDHLRALADLNHADQHVAASRTETER